MMENFIKKKKQELLIYRVLYIIAIIASLAILILCELEVLVPVGSFNSMTLFGVLHGAAFVMIVQAIRVKKALKNSDEMQELFIVQTDERLRLIEKSAAHLTNCIILILLLFFASVFVFINETVSYTLFIVLTAYIIVLALSDIYYRNKY